MRVHRSVLVVCVALGVLSTCRDTTQAVRTQYIGAYEFTPAERRTIARIANATATEVRKLLPALPAQITLRVESGKQVSPEIGALGTAGIDWVFWTVDPDRPEGVEKIAETHLRATLFHEFHHLVRGATTAPTRQLMDHVITEGMASAFERDFAGASYPWNHYPPEVPTWLDELLALPPDTYSRDWIAKERDGRRWIGIRAGTYLVDRAMKALHRTSAELVSTPTEAILAAR
jgi:hypothetical protein